MIRRSERAIHISLPIPASIEAVWEAWTTEEGARSFFAPDCRIDLRPGGLYEMYFDPKAEPGSRGGEGCTVLAIDAPHLLSISWNIPPEVPALRNQNQKTNVVINLENTGTNSTQFDFKNDGYGVSQDWDVAYRYFQRAWGEVVIPRLLHRFKVGPIDWD